MKKNLLYLLAFVCSVTLFSACSSDDDDDSKNNNGNEPGEEAVITAPDVVGTYWGNLNISMIADGSDQETVIADGLPKFITFSQVSDTEIKIELKDFELFLNGQILKFGDIVIDKCTVKKEEGVSGFTGQQDLTFQGDAAALGDLQRYRSGNGGRDGCEYDYQRESACIATDSESYFPGCETGGEP